MPLYLFFPLAIVGTVIYFIIMAAAIINMKPDYFVREKATIKSERQHYLLWLITKIIKNTTGLALIIAGIAMLVLPGQGLLTILMGLFFVDFPGKRKIELFLIQQPVIYRTINAIRERAKKPPIQIHK